MLSFRKTKRTGVGTSLVSLFMRNLLYMGDSAQSNNIRSSFRIACMFALQMFLCALTYQTSLLCLRLLKTF